MSTTPQAERPPIDQSLNVLEYVTIFRTDKWWKVVALTEGWGKKNVDVYLWIMQKGKWTRKQKLAMKSKKEWNEIKDAVEKLLEKL